ncbi:MAG: cytochrome c-type biogenesis protein CcmH [Gammaproteobacteria bacterium]|nr:cytochrome c-type biogenesis protein CcmH [Gammaproteobacteria bacterium]NNF48481.1 cytochrome c-type biogenesis protein CcmH [Woeseiaceae bacterium]NNL63274.1 cytochrome c-type biogenesis protein CcmH [Woeseiaceae bacterium]
MMRCIVAGILLCMAAPSLAIDQERRFEDPAMQARYEQLISEVRCLQCQNQSIKDSNVTLAADLRREIARMIDEGQTDEEIAEFLVTRYGEFALYRPRASGKMLALWIAPFALVLLAGFALVRVVRHRMSMPLDDEESAS